MPAVFALIIANVIWGAAPPIFKFAYENIPPFTLGFLRFAIAMVVIIPFLKKSHIAPVSTRQWLLMFGGAIFIALHLGLFFLGLQKTQSINTSIIGTVGPVFLYFASVQFLHEKKNGKILIGMVIALIGSVVVIVSPLLRGVQEFRVGQFEGNMLILGSVLAEMISVVFLKKVLGKISPLYVTVVMFALSALVFYVPALVELQTWSFSQLDYRGVIGIIFGAILCSTLAYYLYDYGIAKMKAEEVGVFSYIAPVVTVIVAVPLLHELPDPYFYIGAALVATGIFIAERRAHWNVLHYLKRQK